MAKAKKQSAAKFKGQQVAVAYNRHECLVQHPPKKGEHCFPIRAKATSSSKVLAYVEELWLEDVYFFVSPSGLRRIKSTEVRTVCCFVVGTVISKRSSKVTQKHGWTEVRFNPFHEDCFYRVRDRACLRTAKFARLRNRKIEAFGTRKGDPVSSLRDLSAPKSNPGLPTYGPRRPSWRGEMGGQNFELASTTETAAAISWVLDEHPDCVILDGTDDWQAPLYVRPQMLCEHFGIVPSAWWHTGRSGLERSGAVLTRPQWAQLRRAYTQEFGFAPDSCPGPFHPLGRGECGCWEGEGLRVYDRALRRA